MQAIRTLIGAIVGVALGAGFILVLSANAPPQREMWPMLVVGLLAGLSMKILASDGKVSFLRGGLAAAVAIGAYYGGTLAEEKAIQSRAPTAADMPDLSDQIEPDVDDEGEEDAEEPAAAPPPAAPIADGASRPAGTIGANAPQGNEPRDIAFLVVGALLAYQVGKGSSAPAEGEEGEGDAEGEAAPQDDQQGGDGGGEENQEG